MIAFEYTPRNASAWALLEYYFISKGALANLSCG